MNEGTGAMRRDLLVAVGVLLVLLSVLCWSATGYWARRMDHFRRFGRRETDLARHPVGSSVELFVLPGQPSDVMLAERVDALSLGSSLVVSLLCSLACLLWWVVVRRSGYSPAGLAAEAVEGASKGRPSAVAE